MKSNMEQSDMILMLEMVTFIKILNSRRFSNVAERFSNVDNWKLES